MKPLGWRMGANEYAARDALLVRVIVKARHRRWETAEINAALVDIADDLAYANTCEFCLAPLRACYCVFLESAMLGGDCWCDVCVPINLPPIPPITMFDAYKAKRE